MGRVAAVAFTVLIAFLAMLGFAAIVVQEISSLAASSLFAVGWVTRR
jgi:hypothetical protein